MDAWDHRRAHEHCRSICHHIRRPRLGDMDHKTICEIAFNAVNPSTRAVITALIQADRQFASFADASTWPDYPRKRADEHFVNLPRDATGLTDACGEASECVESAIAKHFAVLKINRERGDQVLRPARA